MSQAEAQRAALEKTLSDGALCPLGTATVQQSGRSLYSLLPARQADALGLSKGDELLLAYSAESPAFVVAPLDAVDDVDDLEVSL